MPVFLRWLIDISPFAWARRAILYWMVVDCPYTIGGHKDVEKERNNIFSLWIHGFLAVDTVLAPITMCVDTFMSLRTNEKSEMYQFLLFSNRDDDAKRYTNKPAQSRLMLADLARNKRYLLHYRHQARTKRWHFPPNLLT
jgi:hypothetical protein